MANIDVTPGAGKTVKTDTVGSTEYQVIKLDIGATGTSSQVIAGRQADAFSLPVAISTEDAALIGSLTEAAPATDTASSGLNGRLQRNAQRLTSLITALGSPLQAGGSIGNTGFVASGDVAHDGVDSGNPVKVGARARSSEITTVSNNDRSDLITDLAGKLIILPYANPENFISGSGPTGTNGMTGTTSTSILGAAGAGLRNYITSIVVSNSHPSTSTDVIIQDGNDGPLLLNIPAGAAYGGATLSLPTPLRPSANTALFAKNLTAGANVKVSVVGYKGA